MPPKNIRIFLSLQSQVCLVYKSRDDSTPTVWFQDLACRWHFLATCLTRYFRLQVVHLGIRGWHYAYTDIGLDPVARQFLAFYCPERLYAEDNHLVLAPRAFANRKATSVLSPCNNSKLSIR